MKSKIFLGIVFIIGILGAILYNNHELRSIFCKKEIYISFDPKIDSTNLVDWGRFKKVLPKDFDPNQFLDGSYKGLASNTMRDRIDSIYQAYQKPKRKFINKESGKLKFGIQIGLYEKIFFEYDTLKIYEEGKSPKNMQYTLDSIVNLVKLQDINSYDFHVILENVDDDSKFISKATPLWTVY